MKKILALSLVLMTGSAISQTYDSSEESYNMESSGASSDVSQNMQPQSEEAPLATPGNRHMIEFNIDSILAAAVSFDKIKTEGQESDNNTNTNLSFNYAYGVHRLIQAGMRFNYFTGVNGTEDEENLDFSVGGILNHTDDFSNAAFVALYVGAGWAQQFGDNASRDDLRHATLSVGKRFPLDRWGIKHVTYTPELAVKMLNSTTDESIDYSQSLQLRLLQFSVLF